MSNPDNAHQVDPSKYTDLPDQSDTDFWADSEHERIDTNHPLFAFTPGLTGHQWRQQGGYLVCKSCPVRHAIYIGMNQRLTGFDDEGKPILTSLDNQ